MDPEVNRYIDAQPLGWLQGSTVHLPSHLLSVTVFQWFVMLTLLCVPLSYRDSRALRTLRNLRKRQEGGPACSAALR